jgi:hypothetical protein
MSLFAQKQTASNQAPQQNTQAPAQTQRTQTAQPNLQPVPQQPQPRPSYDQQQPRREVSADIYDGIEKNPDTTRTYIDQVGEYVLEVIKLQDGYKPKGTKNAGKPFFGADFKIVSSTAPGFSPGEEGSWMSTENDYPEYHLKSINNLLSSILKVDSSQINKSTVKDAASENNPAAGYLVRLKVFLDPKGGTHPETGKPYTRKKFSPYFDDPNTQPAA